MTKTTATAHRGPRELTRGDKYVAAVVAVAAAGIALIGFVLSFDGVRKKLEPNFHDLAALVPLGIDLGILVFSGMHLLLVRFEMPIGWLRLVPHSLLAATVYLNVSAGGDMTEKVAHGTMPLLWALAVEVGTHIIAVRTGMASGKRMEGIRLSRWFLAPAPTFKLWRRMKLWEITSYGRALELERERLIAVALLASQYGRFVWRWKAPLMARVELRLAAAPKASAPAVDSTPARAENNPGAGSPPAAPAPVHTPVAPSPAAGPTAPVAVPLAIGAPFPPAPVPALEAAPVEVPSSAPVVTPEAAPVAPAPVVPERSGEATPVTAPVVQTGVPERSAPESTPAPRPERPTPRGAERAATRKPVAKRSAPKPAAGRPSREQNIRTAAERIVKRWPAMNPPYSKAQDELGIGAGTCKDAFPVADEIRAESARKAVNG